MTTKKMRMTKKRMEAPVSRKRLFSNLKTILSLSLTELEGFIVNDEEENEEEENEDENSEEDDEKLDEEDLDLIAENIREQEEEAAGLLVFKYGRNLLFLGKTRGSAHQKFRRLKKAASESEDEDDDGERPRASKR